MVPITKDADSHQSLSMALGQLMQACSDFAEITVLGSLLAVKAKFARIQSVLACPNLSTILRMMLS